jgi:hypothetical protein
VLTSLRKGCMLMWRLSVIYSTCAVQSLAFSLSNLLLFVLLGQSLTSQKGTATLRKKLIVYCTQPLSISSGKLQTPVTKQEANDMTVLKVHRLPSGVSS